MCFRHSGNIIDTLDPTGHNQLFEHRRKKSGEIYWIILKKYFTEDNVFSESNFCFLVNV